MGPPKKKIKLSDNSEDQPGPDFSTLPYDVLIEVFKNLDFVTVTQCAALCRTFYNISHESVIYSKVTFKHNMSKNLLESYISKITCPKFLTVEYKFFENDTEDTEDYMEFEDSINRFVRKSGEYLTCIHFKSCRNDTVLSLLSHCPSLTDVGFHHCKGTFQSLPLLTNLTTLRMTCCVIPIKIVQDTLKNSPKLKVLSSIDSNLNPNDVCESMATHNTDIEEVHFCEKKKLRVKGLKSLARCCKLRNLELTGGSYHCDPEDALQQLAAGCPLLERLTLYGWKEVNDHTLLPVLHSCIKLRKLDLRGINITIKSCREAALSLPFLETLDLYKCNRIKKTEIAKLQRDFQEIKVTMC